MRETDGLMNHYAPLTVYTNLHNIFLINAIDEALKQQQQQTLKQQGRIDSTTKELSVLRQKLDSIAQKTRSPASPK